MPKRLALLALVVVVAAAVTAPVFANVPLQGSVAGISAAQAASLGATVSCRQYSVSGTDAGVNQNQCFISNAACCSNLADPTHNADRCFRTYNTNTNLTPGGYVCNSEATAAYNNDADNQTFYNLIDGEVGGGTGGHIGLYAVEGQIASSTTPTNTGDSRFPACGGAAAALNCFNRADQTNSRPTPLLSTRASFGPGGANTISSAGGLSPVPTARVTRLGQGGCGAGETRVTWDDPHTYAGTMKNGVPSPVLGVNLYKNTSPAEPSGSDGGWTLVGAFPLGSGGTGACVPVSAPSWFATTVRIKGPGNGPLEAESYKSAGSQQVGPDGTVTRIVSLSARYAGRNTVNVSFTSGTEGGVQGYAVTRATSPTGPYTRVSDTISATGDNSRYTFADHLSTRGGLVYYQIDVLKTDGTIEHSGTTSVALPAPRGKKLGQN